MIRSSLKKGIALARRNMGLSLFLLLVNAIFALLLTLPFYWKLLTELGKSLMGKTMLEGFSYSWLVEFNYNNPDFMKTMGYAILPVALLYLLLWSLLSGGILELFKPGGENNRVKRFSSGVARHIFPFLRLAVISSAVYLFVYWLTMVRLLDWAEELIEDSPYPQLEFAVGVGIPLLTLSVVFFLDLIFDYARIRRVIEGTSSMIVALVKSLLFCFRNLSAVITIYIALLFLAGVLIAIYLAVYRLIPQNEMVWIAILFLFQEAFMLARMFVRVSTYSCQTAFYLQSKTGRLD